MIGVENNLDTLGNLIKEARKARNLTVEKLSELTKIKLANLEAMEEDRFEQIAAPTYAKGFLKIVARALDLNEAELLKLYEQRYPQKPKQVIFITENPTARKPRPKKGNRKIVYSLAVLSAFLIGGFWIASSDNPETKPAEKTETAAPKTAPETPAQETAAETSKTAKPEPTAAKPEESSVPAAAAVPADPAVRVEIEALSDVWVKVIADEKLIFENTVRQNEKEEWTAQQKVALRVGRPTDVVLRVNGKPVDLKRQKKPVNLLITPDEVKKYD